MTRALIWCTPVVLLGEIAISAAIMQPGRSNAPPVLFDAPRFTLTERNARPFGSADLAGRVWIADFVFTSCAGPCPVMSQRMAELQKVFADAADLRLVSFSVDPERDTPEVLREYATRYGADPQRWRFLTGDEATIYALARDGFRVLARRSTAAEQQQPGTQEILHSPYFFLVDRCGRVRGTYDSTDPERMARLVADARRLLAGGE